MRFFLIDRIDDLVPGERIRAIKVVSLAEEYLREHFPLTPVLPGVFMLEAMTQAAAWLIRVTEDFRHSLVSLKEASNVKYGKFVEPGQILEIEVNIVGQDEKTTSVRAVGSVESRTAVQARLTLTRSNLAEIDPLLAEADQRIVNRLREWFCSYWPQWAHMLSAGRACPSSL
ncbi:MAG: beta-hydroxyacyl-ACP dehydratase [Thermoguttaceae bacterium]|nr:beta-hydroxyacyl-ACP dehydratase [Thermoguttaceae bacterium]MDW8077832.1 3-hydroxyacyl-ACP dehydratase FabZ family protein [Thermoguttaceae bacterium]